MRRYDHGDKFLSIPKRRAPPLKILDLCTGSGCIPLLLNNLISKSHGKLEIHGWDISEHAIALAKENLRHNFQLGHVKTTFHKRINFEVVDIFDNSSRLTNILQKQSTRGMVNAKVDIIISNPPYISQEAFKKETTRSVRNWEPKLALVPRKPPQSKHLKRVDAADIFYQRLLVLHTDTFRSQVLLMEVGDEEQAIRVAKMAMDHCGTRNHIEIWRENPDSGNLKMFQSAKIKIPVRGSGGFRTVALFKFRNTAKTLYES